MQSIPLRLDEAVACNGGEVSGSPTHDKITWGNPRFLFFVASVPNPKFALPCGDHRSELGIRKDTSKLMILVWVLVQKFS
jgi:hypothetical protein